MKRRLAATALAILLAAGCSGALWSQTRWRAGQERGAEAAPGRRPVTKAEVLERFGAPAEVLPLSRGDAFVYRLRRADLEALNVNAGLVGAAGVPLYANIEGLTVEAMLYVVFDGDGRVVDLATSTR